MSPDPGRILVYGLINPNSGILFYIGQTRKRREFRLLEHLESAVAGSELPVYQYVRKVIQDGFIPKIFVIESVKDVAVANLIEKKWIQFYAQMKEDFFPVKILPQTPKSIEVYIHGVELMNIIYKPRMDE